MLNQDTQASVNTISANDTSKETRKIIKQVLTFAQKRELKIANDYRDKDLKTTAELMAVANYRALKDCHAGAKAHEWVENNDAFPAVSFYSRGYHYTIWRMPMRRKISESEMRSDALMLRFLRDIDSMWRDLPDEDAKLIVFDFLEDCDMEVESGHYESALEFAEMAYYIAYRKWGHWSDEIYPLLIIMSIRCLGVKDYKRALRFAERAMRLSEKIFGEWHDNTTFCFRICDGIHALRKQSERSVKEPVADHVSDNRSGKEAGAYKEVFEYAKRAHRV